jgi:hypothetical protein
MVALDKYDKQNMPKFERLLQKNINFQTRMKPYDFMNDDNEQVCGINLELTSIRQVRAKHVELSEELQQMVKDAKKEAWLMPKKKMKWNADQGKFETPSDSDSEIDEIADKAAARACSKETELNAEEQAIDEDVEKQVAKRFAPVMPPATPVLERTRRRRITALEEQMEALEDADDVKKVLPLEPMKKDALLLQRDFAEIEMLNAQKYGTENEFSDAQAEVKKLDDLIAAAE